LKDCQLLVLLAALATPILPIRGQAWQRPGVARVDSVQVALAVDGNVSKGQADTTDLRAIVELELRRSGVSVTDRTGIGPRSAIATIAVILMGVSRVDGPVFYHIDLAVDRSVQIVGSSEETSPPHGKREEWSAWRRPSPTR